MKFGSIWQVWAVLSAFFAALTAIFAKLGVENVGADFATFVRTVVILFALGAILTASGEWQPLRGIQHGHCRSCRCRHRFDCHWNRRPHCQPVASARSLSLWRRRWNRLDCARYSAFGALWSAPLCDSYGSPCRSESLGAGSVALHWNLSSHDLWAACDAYRSFVDGSRRIHHRPLAEEAH